MKIGDKVKISVWNPDNDIDINPFPAGTIGTIVEDKSNDYFYTNPYRVEANGEKWWYKKRDLELVYDAEDIAALENMSSEEVVEVLKIIYGLLPQKNYTFPTEGRTYSEDEYDATKLHIAMRKAISMIECG